MRQWPPRRPKEGTNRNLTLSSSLGPALEYPDLFLKRKRKPQGPLEAQPQASGSTLPPGPAKGLPHLELGWGPAQSRPAKRQPSFLPSCPSSPLSRFHDSLFPCIKGMTYTEMSSPEPSRSLDIRHPLSFRTPRARITRS